MEFEWDLAKEQANIDKHGHTFSEAIEAFQDSHGVQLVDQKHSLREHRFYWVGKVNSGKILTVWFTRRRIRFVLLAALSGANLGVFIMKQPKLSDLKVDLKGTKAVRKMMAKSRKVKITINVDEGILLELRRMAESMGTPYQTLLNKVLKDALFSKIDEGSRLDRLERELERLKKKLVA